MLPGNSFWGLGSAVKPSITNLTTSSAAGKGSLRLWDACAEGEGDFQSETGIYFVAHLSACVLPKGFSDSEKHRKRQRSIAPKGRGSTIEISIDLV